MESLPFLCIWWTICGLLGYAIGTNRGRPGAGAFWGAFLGPIGWLVVASFPDTRKKCPLCKGALESLTVARCRHCTGDLAAWRARASKPRDLRDPLEAWEQEEAVKPGNLKPLQPLLRKGPVAPEERRSLQQRLGVEDDPV